jgi:general secretion pathway protein L
LTIVPRAPLQPILAALRLAGLAPARIESSDAAGLQPAIPLSDEQPDRSWLGPRTEAGAFACCGFLAAVAVALPLVQQAIASARLDDEIAAVKPQVTEVEALRTKIANAATSSGVVAAANSKVGSALQAIGLLTDILPDDTFLTALSVRGRKVTFSGRSVAAARLIGMMAANPQVHNPAFTAPVIRDDTSGSEMFSIQVELGP